MNKQYDAFLKQLNRTVYLLEKRLELEPEKKILRTLLEYYGDAVLLIENGGDIRSIRIKGGCRAYLDSYSNYSNPTFLSMDKSEEMLGVLLEQSGR